MVLDPKNGNPVIRKQQMSKGNRIGQESVRGASQNYRHHENDNDAGFYEDAGFYDDELHFEDDGYENDEEEEFFDEPEFPRFQEEAGRRWNIRKSLMDEIWDE